MRNWTSWRLCLGLVVAGALFAGGSSQEAPSQATNTAASLTPAASVAGVQAPADQNTVMEDPTEESELADAAVTPISTEKPLPANIRPTGPATEVIRLAESGVEEGVLMAFVTNSASAFNLGAEDIIYLNDIGVPGPVLAAMIQRDQALKELLSSAPPAPAVPVPGATTNQADLGPNDPGLYAPQPAEGAVAPEMAPEAAPPSVVEAGYSAFYDSLAPYGTWVNVAGWGPCWQPTVVIVNPTWRPYCDGGRWIYSDCGWYWLSGYSWGWAPFHYGRWFRHHHFGWCWAPDRVWGPSWVCWRYTGTHCGWAPLPPGAAFTRGGGLTHRGYPVHGSYGFGLGARSFTFVNVSHFRDAHLNRHTLPPQQAAYVFSQTTPAATIVESNSRVINHGIPVSRVAAATHTDIRRVAIHPVSSPAGRGGRSERFEGNSGTLSVFRPHLPPATGTPPASGGRPRSEIRSTGGGLALAPTAQRVAPDPLARAAGGGATVQPSAGQASATRTERPASWSPAPATIRPGSTPMATSPRREAAPGPSSPVILNGSDRPGRGTAGSSVRGLNESSSRQTSVFPGKRDPSPRQTLSQPSGSKIETPRSQPVSPSRDNFSRPAVRERSQPLTTPAWQTPTRSEPSRSASRAFEPPTRSERSWQSSAPSFSAPAPTPREIPTPSFSAPPVRSFSLPTVSSTPRAPVMESRPAPSVSPAPSASAPAGQTHSSSDRRGR